MKTLRVLILSCAVALVSAAASAGNYPNAAESAIRADLTAIQNSGSLNFSTDSRLALHILVRLGTQELAKTGAAAEARAIWQRWLQVSSRFFRPTEDLGDHRELTGFLTNLYFQLRQRLGDEKVKELHLDDIYTMNYAIPVTIHPQGDPVTGEKWDMVEYSKHFVPFSAIVTYWSAYGACRKEMQNDPRANDECTQVSMLLRVHMATNIAPPLSNYVYSKATTHKSGPLPFDLAALRAYYERELAKIIHN